MIGSVRGKSLKITVDQEVCFLRYHNEFSTDAWWSRQEMDQEEYENFLNTGGLSGTNIVVRLSFNPVNEKCYLAVYIGDDIIPDNVRIPNFL